MTKFNDEKDDVLVELSLLGNETAYEELVTRHARSVKGTAFKVTKNEYSAEDASQDAFVSAWMNLDSLRERERFGAWVCSIAKNCAKNIVVRYRSMATDLSYDSLENIDFSDSDESGLLESLVADSTADELHEAVDALSEKIRQAINLHYFEGLSIKEISVKLSLPEGTVKWRLSEGRKQLRKGYGVMEKEYNENETMVARVMRQVEQLKLWRLRDDKSGFADEYRGVLSAVESLDDSKEKSHALADVLQMGLWWLPGQKNDEIKAQIKKAAEDGHNDNVMQCIMSDEQKKFNGQAKIDYIRETQIPYLEANNYPKSLAYVYFWMGYEYRKLGEYEKAIEAFRRVMEIVPPSDVYYANAKAAIYGETKQIEAMKTLDFKHNVYVTGEVYRYIGNKLYFYMQPGYGSDDMTEDSILFWNCSKCDSLIYDPDMKPGDIKVSSSGKMTLKYERNNVTVETPAGKFEGCSIFTLNGEWHGLKHSETTFCPGVGIVAQSVITYSGEHKWALSAYSIKGGDGMIPFAAGNRWEYACLTHDAAVDYQQDNWFEVTDYSGGSATVATCCFTENRGYFDTWEGNTVNARENYYTESDNLVDVKPFLHRAEELAVTKREKLHTAIASDVMCRILNTDTKLNPGTTVVGRWNFFEHITVGKKDGKISIKDDNRKYSFEWKEMGNLNAEGCKVLYNFLYDIIEDATGCVWSDEWVTGYQFSKDIDYWGTMTHTDFTVQDDETVTVPAGTFENCRHIFFERKGLDGGWGYREGCFDYWFAPGVGIVKMSRPLDDGKVENIWQLTEYRGKGKGYFPTDDGIFRRYEPKSLGDGWHASVEYTFDADENGTVMFRNALGTQDIGNYKSDTAKA